MDSIQTNIRKVIAFIGWSFIIMINMSLSTIELKFFKSKTFCLQDYRHTGIFKWPFCQMYGMPINKKEVVTL